MSATTGTPAGPATAPAQRESGLGYMVQSAFWFAVMGLLVKLASAHVPVMQIVLVRGVVTLLLASAVLWRTGLSPLGGDVRLLLLRGFTGSIALICFFAAVAHLPLAEATVIHQTAPLWTLLLAAWLLHERIHGRVLAAMAGAFTGVLMIARPEWLFGEALAAPAPDHWLFAFVALLGAVLSAFAYVTVRRLGRSESPLVVVFWLPLVTVPVAAPFALSVWVWPEPATWGLLLAIGVVTQIAQVALTKGLAREAAGKASAVGYLQVAFATLFGAVVLRVSPDAWGWAGMAAIVCSLLLCTARRAPAAP